MLCQSQYLRRLEFKGRSAEIRGCDSIKNQSLPRSIKPTKHRRGHTGSRSFSTHASSVERVSGQLACTRATTTAVCINLQVVDSRRTTIGTRVRACVTQYSALYRALCREHVVSLPPNEIDYLLIPLSRTSFFISTRTRKPKWPTLWKDRNWGSNCIKRLSSIKKYKIWNFAVVGSIVQSILCFFSSQPPDKRQMKPVSRYIRAPSNCVRASRDSCDFIEFSSEIFTSGTRFREHKTSVGEHGYAPSV